jgi:CTP:molybdopterin cytidylyltransferase MocA
MMEDLRLGGVVLSAGASRRMGRPKAFIEIDGGSFLASGVAILQSARCREIVVVVPPGRVADYQAEVGGGVCVVENPHPELGMLSSLCVGLGALSSAITHAMVTLVDVPLVGSETARLLAEECFRSPEMILVPTADGQPGHPVIYPRAFWGGVVAWPGPEGARGYMMAHPECVRYIETGDPGVVRDFDTPEDLPPGVCR